MVNWIKDKCPIRVCSDGNTWMDCVFLVSPEDKEKALGVLDRAWDDYWEHGESECYSTWLVEAMRKAKIGFEAFFGDDGIGEYIPEDEDEDSNSKNDITAETLIVDTPVGKIKAESKGIADYPGLYVSLVSPNGKESDLCTIEYDEEKKTIGTVAWRDERGSDCEVIIHDWTKKKEKRLFSARVKEHYEKEVAVWAGDRNEAWNRIVELCSAGEIKTGKGDFCGRECAVDIELDPCEAEDYQYVCE